MQLHSGTSSTFTRWETLNSMPRISGRSSWTTTSCIRFRPNDLMVSRCGCGRPITERTWVMRSRVMPAPPSHHGRRAPRPAGDHAGAGRGGLEQDPGGRVLAEHLVRDGAADHRHREEALLGDLDALLDRRRHLAGLAVADAHPAVAVSHHDQGGEGEPPASLDHLGDAVDRDDPLLELRLRGIVPARTTAVVTGRPVALSTGTPASGGCCH